MSEVRNGQPWANPEGYKIKPSTGHEDEIISKEWRLFIDQSNHNIKKRIFFYDILVSSFENNVFGPGANTVALFHVRRRILHDYTWRDCNLCSWFRPHVDTFVVEQVRHNYTKHLTNYSYPAEFWERYKDGHHATHTVAIFHVKRKES